MPSPRVPEYLNEGTYFLTFTIKKWYYILDRYNRWEILAKSLEYCRKNKDLKVLGFVFMINHIHLIVSSPDISGFIRDYKKFCSYEIIQNIKFYEPNVLKLFKDEEGHINLWEKTNMPKFIESEKYFLQKQSYIHQNPVKRNYVMREEDWYWSSANELCELKVDNFWD